MVAKGKKVLHFETASADTEALAKAICGPSGTLRAPAMQVGDTFLVGYHEEAYGELFD